MSQTLICESVNTLDSTISALQRDLSYYTQLQSLVDRLPNILKLETHIAHYKKKIDHLRKVLKSSKSSLLKQIPAKHPKKHPKNRSASQNLANTKATQQIRNKKLEILFKEEACGAVFHLNSCIENEKNSINSSLERLKLDLRHSMNGEEMSFQVPEEKISLNQKKSRENFLSSLEASIKNRCETLASSKLLEFEQAITQSLQKIQNL